MRGKKLLMLLLLSGIVLTGLLMYFYGYENTWRIWNIPIMEPFFADARIITGGSETYHEGHDPLVMNPRDPWSRPMNYPRIWHSLFFLGIDQRDTVWLGTVFIVLFFAGMALFVGDIPPRTAVLLFFGVFSPAVMLGIERGNSDLVIFFFLAASAAVVKRSAVWSTVLVVFAYVLKLYPLAGAAVLLRENRRRFLQLAGGALLCGLVYLYATYGDVLLISNATPKAAFNAYGRDVLWRMFATLPVENALRIIVVVILTAGAVWVMTALFRKQPEGAMQSSGEPDLDAFRTGAAVYIATFLIGSNYVYRLVFLLFTVPQLIRWLSDGRTMPVRRIVATTLVSIYLALWHLVLVRFMQKFPGGWQMSLLIDQAAHWSLFLGLSYLIVYSLPDWVRGYASRVKTGTGTPGAPARP